MTTYHVDFQTDKKNGRIEVASYRDATALMDFLEHIADTRPEGFIKDFSASMLEDGVCVRFFNA